MATIEIIARATCPTCHGDGAVPSGNEYFGQVEMVGCPEGCDDNGDVTRVLATFADVAALRAAFDDAYLTVGPYAHLAMEVLGVTNEPQ